MKSRMSKVLGVGFGLLAMCVLHAGAVGLGFYGGAGAGSQTWTASASDYDHEFETDTDTDSVGGEFGFLLDTAVANDSLFNYRLGLGYEALTYTFDTPGGHEPELEMNLFVIDNIFGFGVVRTRAVRLWIGPELRLFGGSGDSDFGDSVNLVGGGIGPAVGVNIHAGPVVSFTVSGSALYIRAYGENQDEGELTYDVSGIQGYVRFGLLFRIRDELSNVRDELNY